MGVKNFYSLVKVRSLASSMVMVTKTATLAAALIVEVQ